mgnify:CR=1 FL=1
MKKWVLLVIVVLVAGLALVPAVFAQGPLNQDSSSYGNGPMMRTDFGPGNGQRMGNAASPAFGMGPRWGGSSGSLITVAAEQLGLTVAYDGDGQIVFGGDLSGPGGIDSAAGNVTLNGPGDQT